MFLKKFHFKKITSTNDKSIKLIKAGHKKGIVVADFQTKGKGRHGNKWISLNGNLHMSVFFEINKKLLLNKLIKFNLNIIKETLQKFSKKKIKIKLPNDLTINRKKVCGILQEIIFDDNQKFLIVGIGVNIKDSPKIDKYPTSYLNNYLTNKTNKLVVCKYIKMAYEKNNLAI